MKRIIFIGILVSLFAFSGLAFAGIPVPDEFCECSGYADATYNICDEEVIFFSGIPEREVRPNRWISYDVCMPDGEQFFGWYAQHRGRGDQAGFEPSFDGTYGCNCADIIYFWESVYDFFGIDESLDGHIKFGCSKSLIEDFIDVYPIACLDGNSG